MDGGDGFSSEKGSVGFLEGAQMVSISRVRLEVRGSVARKAM